MNISIRCAGHNLQRKAFFRSIGGNVKAFHNQDKTPAGDLLVNPGGGSYLKPY